MFQVTVMVRDKLWIPPEPCLTSESSAICSESLSLAKCEHCPTQELLNEQGWRATYCGHTFSFPDRNTKQRSLEALGLLFVMKDTETEVNFKNREEVLAFYWESLWWLLFSTS